MALQMKLIQIGPNVDLVGDPTQTTLEESNDIEQLRRTAELTLNEKLNLFDGWWCFFKRNAPWQTSSANQFSYEPGSVCFKIIP